MREIFIYDVVRTPRGKGRDGGGLSAVRPIDQLGQLYRALQQRGSALDEVADVVIGCVTQVRDQGTNIAKISCVHAGLPDHIPGMTINRFCTSGLDSVATATAQLAAGMGGELQLAGGVESMSRVPIFSDKGCWFADPEVATRTRFVQMGVAADIVASLRGYERARLDAWAARSHLLAAQATERGHFAPSLIAVETEQGTLSRDEPVRPGTSVEQLAQMEPAFADERAWAMAREVYPELDIVAMHHRGNSPSMADGAAVALLGSAHGGELIGKAPRARVLSWGTASMEPVQMLTASIQATELAVARAGLSLSDIDLFEVNEAFAAPTLAYLDTLALDESKVNVNGGTIALGHAMGATGTMLLAQALDELERREGRYALIALAGGAGVGSAMVIERVTR